MNLNRKLPVAREQDRFRQARVKTLKLLADGLASVDPDKPVDARAASGWSIGRASAA
jgi:hypothetical protein